MKQEDQKQTGIFQILSHPYFYNLSQTIFGKNKLNRILVKDYLKAQEGDYILDIGCGPAKIVEFLPKKISYVGFDANGKYITYAQRKYKERVQLYDREVNEASAEDFNKFDFIIAITVIHHLNDQETRDLFNLGYNLLKPSGKMITIDATWNDSDNFLAKLLFKCDRGNHIRYPHQYFSLANEIFKKTNMVVRKDMLFIPGSLCVIECKKA